MIPRFIIQRTDKPLLNMLVAKGFEIAANPLSEDVLVLGTRILNSTIAPVHKNPLVKVFDAYKHLDQIMETAELQVRWNNNGAKAELLLGDPPLGKVVVTPVGVMIDSHILPIESFRKLYDDLLKFKSPFIVTHEGVINENRPFVTVGCADYSMKDLSTIIAAFDKLLEPAS